MAERSLAAAKVYECAATYTAIASERAWRSAVIGQGLRQ